VFSLPGETKDTAAKVRFMVSQVFSNARSGAPGSILKRIAAHHELTVKELLEMLDL
jgi:hypothetical protein